MSPVMMVRRLPVCNVSSMTMSSAVSVAKILVLAGSPGIFVSVVLCYVVDCCAVVASKLSSTRSCVAAITQS